MNLVNLSLPPNIKAELPSVIKTFNIDSALRMAHFLGQCAHESGNFRYLHENLNYSADGLRNVFRKYFTMEQAEQYARKPEAIASRVYANRMGNGNEASKDGWNYRGRGAIQLTGKNNYREFDKYVVDDILSNPELVAEKYPLLSAAWFWTVSNINPLADKDDSLAITRKVNGGTKGLSERRLLTAKYKRELGI